MIYILNTHLNLRKKIFIALNDIYGLGNHTCLQLCDLLGISKEKRLKQLSEFQLETLTQLVNQNYHTGSEIKRTTLKNLQRLVKIACYRGFRHTEGLPVRGQRTHGNSKTRKKLKNLTLSQKK